MIENLLSMTGPVRESFEIPCHRIGPEREAPTLALVAGLQGDDINGIFILARLADFLRGIDSGAYPGLRLTGQVLIVPAVNVLGVNTRSRTWPFDRTDFTAMFPGSPTGETTQRIAYALLQATRGAQYRVQIDSPGSDFEETPQVRMYGPSDAERERARQYGLPVMERMLVPVFATTLMHSWEAWPGESFVLRGGQAGTLQPGHCQRLFHALVLFLGRNGVVQGVEIAEGDEENFILSEAGVSRLYAGKAGTFVSQRQVGTWVRGGDELGRLYDSVNGHLLEKVVAPVSGLVTGIRRHPLLFEGDLVVRLNRKL